MHQKIQNLSDLERQILSEAIVEFESRGFYEASIDDIASRLKIGKGTIYRHFGNKMLLYVSIVLFFINELEKSFFNVQQAESFEDFFELFIQSMINFTESRGRFLVRFFFDANRFATAEVIEKNPKLRETFAYIMEQREKGIAFLERILKQGAMEKKIASDMNLAVCAEMIFVLINNFLINSLGINQMKCMLNIPQKFSFEEGVRELKKTLYRAIGYHK